MSLAKYRQKRNFGETAEPRGAAKKTLPKKRAKFVVQKHDASHLHYDFRLELDGVLKSWAVPKGPSLDPAQKRLAVEVEDHPLEYGSFEGTIPQGQYGGGTVMLWDRGTWQADKDPRAGYRAGRLKFELAGRKLRGSWMLVRRGGAKSGKPQWLLFKLRDGEAHPENEFNITVQEPLSVKSGRDLGEIAAGKKATSKQKTKVPTHKTAKPKTARRSTGPKSKSGHDPWPRSIDPELPTLVAAAPTGDEWLHEMKFDGYRMLAFKNGDRVRFQTRNRLDWTHKVTALAEAVGRLKVEQVILDGEVVALDDQGISNFQLLQNAFRDPQSQHAVFMAFDLLYLDGVDLRTRPLEERQAELARLRLPAERGLLRSSQSVIGKGAEFFEQARRAGLEGIVSKRRQSTYHSGRSLEWVKTKYQNHSEFVIGGFTEPGGSRKGFGALLLGYFDRQDHLAYAGRVGTGFSERLIRQLTGRLESIERRTSPFVELPPGVSSHGVHWVRPELVAQITFSNWTRDELLRHPSFQGLREDKPAHDVHREKPRKGVPVTSRGNGHGKHGHGHHGGKKASEEIVARKSNATETEIAGVRITHPDRVLYPEAKITKRTLAEYYVAVAEQMLPQVVGRPVSIVRCPDGVTGSRFFQKHPPDAAPKEMHRTEIREKSGMATYLVVEDVRDLVGLVQISALEIHVWGSRTDKIERPDQLVFDLDPAPELPWSKVAAAGLELREFLEDLELTSFAKLTGGKGLHLVVPIARKHEWPDVARFCRAVAQAVERAAPDRYTAVLSKRARVGKIFIDYLRNQRGATAIAPFSTRANESASVAAPVSWRELSRIKRATAFDLPAMLRRLKAAGRDRWKGFDEVSQSITRTMLKRLGAND